MKDLTYKTLKEAGYHGYLRRRKKKKSFSSAKVIFFGDLWMIL
ncbi:MAG: hypothetical protein ACLVJQ_00680 [Lentihominibacter sp.]